jgi:hypothetical protein
VQLMAASRIARFEPLIFMVGPAGIPFTGEINDLQWLPDRKGASDAKGFFPALANPLVHSFTEARSKLRHVFGRKGYRTTTIRCEHSSRKFAAYYQPLLDQSAHPYRILAQYHIELAKVGRRAQDQWRPFG